MLSFASAGPSAYWYLTRGTGTVAVVLLTLSVALGVANVRRVRTRSVPRFVFDAMHRNVSLLGVAFVVAHILTSLLDSFAPINLIDAFVPFISAYRPLWLGLGTVAFDLLVAVAITSLVRQRLGYRAWRRVHWAAYACWPVALLHGLGTGSDTKTGWMLAIAAGCVVLLVAAVASRATAGWGEHVGARLTALGVSALLPLGLLVWLPGGPLARNWPRRAGTPASLLGAAAPASGGSGSRGSAGSGPASSKLPARFTAQATGMVRQGPLPNGLVGVDILLTLSGENLTKLAVHLQGQAIEGGGVQMSSSSVTLGTASNPTLYRGTVSGLAGTNINATVQDGQGHSLNLGMNLQIESTTGSATGTVTATP